MAQSDMDWQLTFEKNLFAAELVAFLVSEQNAPLMRVLFEQSKYII